VAHRLLPAIALYTIVLGTLSVAWSLIETRGYFAHWCARTWSRLILATTGVRVHVAGLDRLEPGRTYFFVANHQSIYDIPILFWSLPYQLRIIAKESLGSVPFLGWHLRRTGHMLVDRRHPNRARVFGWASRLTSDGLSLIVFPEGTRSRDGRVAPFKGGSFLLALDAGLPVVPLSIVGSRHVMLKGRLAAYPADVTLIVHEPIDTRELAGTRPRSFAERVRGIIAPDAESDLDTLPPHVTAARTAFRGHHAGDGASGMNETPDIARSTR
jgi:1-acyl-sn-glycerol-3-phosphate acyltransferase